jgi:hypothetical protein
MASLTYASSQTTDHFNSIKIVFHDEIIESISVLSVESFYVKVIQQSKITSFG